MSSIKVHYKTLRGEQKEVQVQGDQPLLDQLQAAGIDQPSSCMSGACGTCRTRVLSGREALDEEKFGMALYPTESDEILTCICGIQDAADGALVELEELED